MSNFWTENTIRLPCKKDAVQPSEAWDNDRSWRKAVIPSNADFREVIPRDRLRSLRDWSTTDDVHDRLDERKRRFLWQIVPNSTGYKAVLIFAGEFFGIGSGIRMRRAVGITFEGDGGYSNYRECGEPFFQLVVLPFAVSHAEPPAIVMNCNTDVIRIFERGGAAVEGGVVETPLRRRDL